MHSKGSRLTLNEGDTTAKVECASELDYDNRLRTLLSRPPLNYTSVSTIPMHTTAHQAHSRVPAGNRLEKGPTNRF